LRDEAGLLRRTTVHQTERGVHHLLHSPDGVDVRLFELFCVGGRDSLIRLQLLVESAVFAGGILRLLLPSHDFQLDHFRNIFPLFLGQRLPRARRGNRRFFRLLRGGRTRTRLLPLRALRRALLARLGRGLWGSTGRGLGGLRARFNGLAVLVKKVRRLGTTII